MTLITDKIRELQSPIDMMFLMHKVFLIHSEKAAELAKKQLNGGNINEFRTLLDKWLNLLIYHYQIEDEFMTGPLKEKEYQDGRMALRDNVNEHNDIKAQGQIVVSFLSDETNTVMNIQEILKMDDEDHSVVMEKIDIVKKAINDALGKETLVLQSRRHLYQSVLSLKTTEFDHFENEEAFVLPLVRKQMSHDKQLELAKKLLFDNEAVNPNWVYDFVLKSLNVEEQKLLEDLVCEMT
jgi:hypothetical protein